MQGVPAVEAPEALPVRTRRQPGRRAPAAPVSMPIDPAELANTRLIVKLDTPFGCQAQRIPLGQRAPLGWSDLARVDRASHWGDDGACDVFVVTTRGRRQATRCTRSVWNDMEARYRGADLPEPVEEED